MQWINGCPAYTEPWYTLWLGSRAGHLELTRLSWLLDSSEGFAAPGFALGRVTKLQLSWQNLQVQLIYMTCQGGRLIHLDL